MSRKRRTAATAIIPTRRSFDRRLLGRRRHGGRGGVHRPPGGAAHAERQVEEAGGTPVQSEPGIELVVLGWAIEDADVAAMPQAIANWRGMHPHERRYLFFVTARSSGYAPSHRRRGWRAGLRIGSTETPIAAAGA